MHYNKHCTPPERRKNECVYVRGRGRETDAHRETKNKQERESKSIGNVE